MDLPIVMMDPFVPAREAVDAMSLRIGVPSNVVRLMIGLIGGCLLAPLSHLLSSPRHRHTLNTVVGMAMGWFVFDVSLVHSIVPTVLVYTLMVAAPRHLVGQITAVVLFAYLVAAHALREFGGASIMWDAPQMVLTLKLTGTAISFADGALPTDKKSDSMLRNQLLDRPSFLALFGYVYFFPTFLVGPIFEFNEYLMWVDRPQVAPWRVTLYVLAMLVVCIAGHAASELYFPILAMDRPTYYSHLPFPARLCLQLVASALMKFRFYMVWQFGELGGILAGYGYNDTTRTWDGLQNNNLFLVEIPVNLRVAINNWNIKVAKWLNTYVYQRVGLHCGKPTTLSTFAVFIASAAWHGLLPGYYAFFIMGGLGTEVGRHVRRRCRHYFHYTEDRQAHPWAPFLDFLDPKKASPLAIVYDVGGVVLSWVMIGYCAPSFVWLDMARCFKWWSTVYCIPHIVTVVTLVAFLVTDPKQPRKAT
ncbi:Aste57867_8672 [Aphanomyces stellatus]|uniref:Aste57867_8672 protein n=1 Tax=Aphanomyces stellatus TaxID=120398 RepID=A0A485KL35_9STRA|nr:hypothetical protein As57867_008638 [Aphanomyces stellatus]VFT85558.1 Aste57867_8672 [Aphanomyces stellatus]